MLYARALACLLLLSTLVNGSAMAGELKFLEGIYPAGGGSYDPRSLPCPKYVRVVETGGRNTDSIVITYAMSAGSPERELITLSRSELQVDGIFQRNIQRGTVSFSRGYAFQGSFNLSYEVGRSKYKYAHFKFHQDFRNSHYDCTFFLE